MPIQPNYSTGAPLLLINGSTIPYDSNYPWITGNPARDYNELTEQLVKSTRNAKGEVVSQVINRRLRKFDNLTWSVLTRSQVHWLEQEIAKFNCTLSYWDTKEDAWITREYYWGDFSATPYEWETCTAGGRTVKRPKLYKEVKANLIDKGLSGSSSSSSSSSSSGSSNSGGGSSNWRWR